MHVKAKMTAYGGLFLAVCVVFMILGSVFETATLFFLAAASYFVGIVIREMGMMTGTAFYLAAVILGMILAPNKFYVLTFGAMGLYILLIEGIWRLACGRLGRRWGRKQFWLAKYIVFNCLYLPGIFLFQKLLFARSLSGMFLAGVIAAGQICLYVYDHAYEYTQARIWSRMRRHLFPSEV